MAGSALQETPERCLQIPRIVGVAAGAAVRCGGCTRLVRYTKSAFRCAQKIELGGLQFACTTANRVAGDRPLQVRYCWLAEQILTLTNIQGVKNGAKTLVRVRPRGFCAGVVRAVDIVELALEAYGRPVYVHHEIVHNRYVVDQLRRRGAIFVEAIEEVPVGAVLVFSAHGVPPRVRTEAKERQLRVIDATCPLVTKVHVQGRQYVAAGRTLILIGHAGHPEVEGTIGQIPGTVLLVQSEADVVKLDLPLDAPLAYVTQTTLSVDDTRGIIDALLARFSDIVGPDTRDICYATQNRQAAVRELSDQVEVLLVVGATNSSNSNRLREIGSETGVPSYLVADGSEVKAEWFANVQTVGITAGASAPEEMVENVIDALRALGPVEVSTMAGREEKVEFKLPSKLLQPLVAREV